MLNDDFSYGYDFPSALMDLGSPNPPLPFSDVENVAAGSSPTYTSIPGRRAVADGVENFTALSPFRWDQQHEEDKVVHDLGIEDPDEEEQLAVFNSIPGFDDDWDEESDSGRANGERSTRQDGACHGLQDCLDNTASQGYAEEYPDTDYEDEHTDITDAEEDRSSDRSDSDGSSLDTDSEEQDDSDVDQESPSSDPVNPPNMPRSGDSPILEEDQTSTAVEHAADATVSRSRKCESGRSSNRVGSPSTVHPAPRRSARIRGANPLKRARDEDEWEPEEEEEDVAPPPKRARRKATKVVSQGKANASRRTKVKTRAKRQGARPSTAGPSTTPEKRSGRIPPWFIDSCIINDPATVECGVPGCETVLDLKRISEARAHVKDHHKGDARGAKKVECRWEGCTDKITNAPNADPLKRHYSRKHFRLVYGCPGECTNARGERRTWSRSDELTRHESESPCEYVKKHPFPRGNARDTARTTNRSKKKAT
ncbi:hypothetical protein C8Q77DRAFT_1208397 [Trametes polyzona]|nr:hypothetical protein C8Q77DRAFT_1208397 [Trametes polyzona]